jgi:hypothetical protein
MNGRVSSPRRQPIACGGEDEIGGAAAPARKVKRGGP